MDYPILSDPLRTAAAAYGVLRKPGGLPNRWTFFIGPDGTITHIDKEVRPNSHGADCAARLGQLGVPKVDEANE